MVLDLPGSSSNDQLGQGQWCPEEHLGLEATGDVVVAEAGAKEVRHAGKEHTVNKGKRLPRQELFRLVLK